MSGAPPPDPLAPPPFLERLPDAAGLPVVISVPHAGRFYPPEIDGRRAVGWQQLRDLEDRYADRLIGPAVAAGATAIVATHARAWIDLNRAPGDRPDRPESPHGRAGLGVIPLRLGGRALWRAIPDAEDVAARVEALHRPYHAAIGAALSATRRRFGHALLIDCHSMPPIASGPGRAARIVIGDRHGASARADIVMAIEAAAARAEVPALRNTPYAGAYTIDAHSDPERGLHAVQLEFDRSLYLEPGLREPGARLPAIADLLGELCRAGAAALDSQTRLAAE